MHGSKINFKTCIIQSFHRVWKVINIWAREAAFHGYNILSE
jgi:hypothetical protein